MNEVVVDPVDLAPAEASVARLRDQGLPLVRCAPSGAISHLSGGEHWLTTLAAASTTVREASARAVARWNGADAERPEPVEALPGLWLLPILPSGRVETISWIAAIAATDVAAERGSIDRLSAETRSDAALSRAQFERLPPVAAREIPRIAELVRSGCAASSQHRAEELAIERLASHLADSYEEINLLYTIIQSMNVVDRPERFVSLACQELHATMPYRWIGVLFADDPRRLKKLAGAFIVAGQHAAARARVRELVGRLLEEASPNVSIVLEARPGSDGEAFADLGRTVLAHPIGSDDAILGLIVAGDPKSESVSASAGDMKLLGAAASHTAIFVENAALYEDLSAMFLGTLEALTASIDAKDRYTCGHSHRVALLTRQLASAAGLDDETVGRMHIAGLVHDVGKIGVPERVLTKPGRLSEEEFAWVRRHPEIGARILRDIPQFEDIIPGVLHHHERWDGGGYPSGLRGEEIPLVGRVIALADAFDAMSSDRTYRSRLTRGEVMREISRCAGTQFDPELVPLFLDLDLGRWDDLAGEQLAAA